MSLLCGSQIEPFFDHQLENKHNHTAIPIKNLVLVIIAHKCSTIMGWMDGSGGNGDKLDDLPFWVEVTLEESL